MLPSLALMLPAAERVLMVGTAESAVMVIVSVAPFLERLIPPPALNVTVLLVPVD